VGGVAGLVSGLTLGLLLLRGGRGLRGAACQAVESATSAARAAGRHAGRDRDRDDCGGCAAAFYGGHCKKRKHECEMGES